jgi:threonine dehydrogenase-like Zn-dependent dehydrogenase
MMGAGRVIAFDEVPERRAMAVAGGAETIDFSATDVYDELMARPTSADPTAVSMRWVARHLGTAPPMRCSTK